jgi:hypothetical protein
LFCRLRHVARDASLSARRTCALLHLGLWLLFWVAVIVVAWLPDTTNLLARWLGVGRGVDTAMYCRS